MDADVLKSNLTRQATMLIFLVENILWPKLRTVTKKDWKGEIVPSNIL